MRILALDQGTSATKALIVSPEAGVLAACTVAVHPRVLAHDAVEQDPDERWSALVAAGRAALARAPGAIDAVALANQG